MICWIYLEAKLEAMNWDEQYEPVSWHSTITGQWWLQGFTAERHVTSSQWVSVWWWQSTMHASVISSQQWRSSWSNMPSRAVSYAQNTTLGTVGSDGLSSSITCSRSDCGRSAQHVLLTAPPGECQQQQQQQQQPTTLIHNLVDAVLVGDLVKQIV